MRMLDHGAATVQSYPWPRSGVTDASGSTGGMWRLQLTSWLQLEFTPCQSANILEWAFTSSFRNLFEVAITTVACAPFSNNISFLLYFHLPYPLMCMDIAHREQTATLTMTFSVSLYRATMILILITVKSAVFPMSVQPTEPDWETF